MDHLRPTHVVSCPPRLLRVTPTHVAVPLCSCPSLGSRSHHVLGGSCSLLHDRIRAVGPRPCSPAEPSGGKTGVGHPYCLFQPRAVCPSFGDSELDRNLGFNKKSASGQHSSFESASSAGLLALPLGYSSVPPGRLWAVPDLNALPRGGSFTATCCVGLWAPYPPEPG